MDTQIILYFAFAGLVGGFIQGILGVIFKKPTTIVINTSKENGLKEAIDIAKEVVKSD